MTSVWDLLSLLFTTLLHTFLVLSSNSETDCESFDNYLLDRGDIIYGRKADTVSII